MGCYSAVVQDDVGVPSLTCKAVVPPRNISGQYILMPSTPSSAEATVPNVATKLEP